MVAKKEKAFDIVLIDPPFTKKLAHLAMQQIVSSQAVDVNTQIVIESSKQYNSKIQ